MLNGWQRLWVMLWTDGPDSPEDVSGCDAAQQQEIRWTFE